MFCVGVCGVPEDGVDGAKGVATALPIFIPFLNVLGVGIHAHCVQTPFDDNDRQKGH